MAEKGWDEVGYHVLAELKDFNTNIKDFKKKNDADHKEIFTAIATLKVKAGIWGALAGVIPGSLVALYFLIRYFNGG